MGGGRDGESDEVEIREGGEFGKGGGGEIRYCNDLTRLYCNFERFKI